MARATTVHDKQTRRPFGNDAGQGLTQVTIGAGAAGPGFCRKRRL